jgi:hypothetical protein
LERATHLSTVDPVEGGLAVRHDQVGVTTAELLDRLSRRGRERLPDPGVEPAHLLQRSGCRRQ